MIHCSLLFYKVLQQFQAKLYPFIYLLLSLHRTPELLNLTIITKHLEMELILMYITSRTFSKNRTVNLWLKCRDQQIWLPSSQKWVILISLFRGSRFPKICRLMEGLLSLSNYHRDKGTSYTSRLLRQLGLNKCKVEPDLVK